MTLELPLEVWTIIAEHIVHSSKNLRDWARASGTCRTSFSVQLAEIKAKPETLSELQWVLKRSQCAKVLALDLWKCSDDAELSSPELDARMEDCAAMCLSNMSQLGVCLKSSEPQHWLTALLCSAANLQLLQMELTCPQSVPPLRFLKHMVLYLKPFLEVEDSFCSQFGNLPCLETLNMQLTLRDREFCLRHLRVELPALDLRSCGHLRAVNFHDILPAAIKVPVGCAVFVTCMAEYCANAWASWRHVCTTLFLDAGHRAHINSYIPKLPCQGLRFLILNLEKGRDSIDLAGVFPNLETLRLYYSGHNLRVKLPAKLCSFYLRSRGHVNVVVDNMSMLVQNLSVMDLGF